ncbi:MAG TPA: DNA replication/repair protein RecF [Candidatus Krumholzibacteria bacterium]|nr:DNA replication/repair protein RecF [Candidatus Krumholzibacteria bacterium]
MGVRRAREAASAIVRVQTFRSTNLRNLASGEIGFGPGLNFLVGENGQGKTNLLEAIYFFRHGHSFRAGSDTELIRFDETFCRAEIDAEFADAHRETFTFSVERRGAKTIKIDGQILPRRTELAGRFPAVLFGPADLRIVSGEPDHRRRFFDMVGTMTDPAYLRCARDYRRALEQRNAALKARAGRDEIGAWNERLVSSGVDLISHRRELVASMEAEMNAHAAEVESPFAFAMRYESVLLEDGGDEISEQVGLTHAFHDRLAAVAHEESRRGITLVGPHRDDIAFTLAGQDLRRFGSQGQRRLLAVLLKLAELTHLETELREPCVLLLDDVFSEFDASIMARLQRMLDGARQVFITSPVAVDDVHAPRARRFAVAGGRITSA